MQKKLLTMAVAGALAAPVAALAQVTVYGTIDTGIANQSKVVTGPGTDDSVLVVTDGLRTTNRWGLKGSEDLGGGLMANFTLEGQYSSDTGAGPGPGLTGIGTQGIFQRKSIVGLSKAGMSVDLGRDYTVNFKANGVMDPMSFTYTGRTTTAGGTFTAGTRSSDLVTAGFRFGTGGIRIDYALGEALGAGVPDNDRLGIGADFAFGPVTVAAAFSTQETAVNVDTTTTNLGAVYRMGPFTFRGGVNMRDIDLGNEDMQWMLGVQYGFSPTLNGRFGYYNWTTDNAAGTEIGEKKVFIVALDYYLSKRTTAYVALDRQDLSGTQAPGTVGSLADGATAVGVGIAHSF